ncbi:MAG: hypothetical protein KIT31_16090 [Deltaproteobacteria bacterium]|nr:hypothetical protein [Deltaproteobacteria bacterium]
MQQRNGFSVGSVILSYFMTAGGMFSGLLLLGALDKADSDGFRYLMMLLGSFLGGFVAARASRGTTIVEPAVGAVLMIATLVIVGGSTTVGKMIWSLAQDGVAKHIAIGGGACIVGALGGAYASEKMFGESTTSSVPWILYIAIATFGAAELAFIVILIVLAGNLDTATSSEAAGTALFGGMALGCLLSGIAAGAGARARPLLAALVGGSLGIAGFFGVFLKVFDLGNDMKGELITGLAIIAILGGVVTLIGALIGWFAYGKRHAG